MRLSTTVAVATVLGMAAYVRAAGPAGRPLLVTVDDLPIAADSLHAGARERTRITDGLLEVLARHKAPAVGFVTWGNVHGDADVELLDRWLAAGHELGNHSLSHLHYAKTARDVYIADVEAGRAGLARVLDRHALKVRFFRFPYLEEGDTAAKLDAMRDYLARSGQRAMPVTVDDQDWSFERAWVRAQRTDDTQALARIADDYQRTLRTEVEVQTREGDELFGHQVPQILLLHANAVGLAQWDDLFTWLEGRGYRFATADEVLADPVLSTPHRFVSGPGGSLWRRLAHERESAGARQAVAALLADQAAAWTRGDLEAFCAAYADDAVFVSPTGLTRGRDEVLRRYRARYPDRAAMGALTLEVLDLREAWGDEATELGDAVPSGIHGASVVARWTLRRADGSSATGLTLLVLARRDGAWQIVEDASM
jgi:uncharacterized protein (TIGR02246 family)